MNRTTRSLSLTEVGERYFKLCLSILAEIEESGREVRQHSEELQGSLHVSCLILFASGEALYEAVLAGLGIDRVAAL